MINTNESFETLHRRIETFLPIQLPPYVKHEVLTRKAVLLRTEMLVLAQSLIDAPDNREVGYTGDAIIYLLMLCMYIGSL